MIRFKKLLLFLFIFSSNSYANYFPNNCASINSFGIEIEQCLSEKYKGEVQIFNFKQPRDNDDFLLITYCYNQICHDYEKKVTIDDEASASIAFEINGEYIVIDVYETASLVDIDKIVIGHQKQ